MKEVKLHSVFKLHPFISFILLNFLALLAVGFFPSFLTNSRRVYFTTSVYPLRLEVDGISAGFTPSNMKLLAGKHTMSVYYGSEKLAEKKFRVRSALLFSYIFEYSAKVSADVVLSEELKAKITSDFLKDCILYSTLFIPDAVNIQKPVFSQYKSLLGDDADKSAVEAGKYFIANKDAEADCNKAFGGNYSISSFGPELLFREKEMPFAFRGEKKIGGIPFEDFGSLMVMKDEVSCALYENFLKDREFFRRGNLKQLIETEFVDKNYLAGFGSSEAVRNVSVLAAAEFCDWFSEKFKVRARLLSKREYSALLRFSDRFSNLKTSFYEITSTPFIPYEILTGNEVDKGFLVDYSVIPHYELFCFSDYNADVPDEKRTELVGVIPASTCMETVGFRIAIDTL